jgi:hypothetical protein
MVDAGTVTTIALSNDKATPEMIRAAYTAVSSTVSVSLIAMILCFALLFMFFLWVVSVFKDRKSLGYRKLMNDLYIVGLIKKFATEDGVDLDAEYKSFQRFEKKRRNNDKDLDVVIESETTERISAKNEAAVEKIEKGYAV